MLLYVSLLSCSYVASSASFVRPADANIATVLHKISRRVIRALRQLRYLESSTEDVVPTGYDPVRENDPELARTMAASVQQRIAFGERAGHQVGLWLRRRAPHSTLRAAITPTPRQQGVEEPEGSTASPNWTWAQLLKRVFTIDLERCPVCQQGMLRIIAAMTEVRVIQTILRHAKLAVDPPPSAPAQQAAFAWGA